MALEKAGCAIIGKTGKLACTERDWLLVNLVINFAGRGTIKDRLGRVSTVYKED